jgi:peptidyl-prolyl cis-trans isomerase D
MATLEKIRSKGVLLLIIIGLAMFAFIIGDFLNSGSSFFRQSQNKVGEVNGEVIRADEFMEAINQLSEVYKIEYGMSSLDENINEQIRESVWETMVKEKLLTAELSKIGISLGKDELKDMVLGNNIHPLITGRRVFYNQNTDRFDKEILRNFLASLEETPETNEQKQQLVQAKNYWLYFENLIKTTRLEEKYQTLLTKGINPNSLDAKFAYEARKNSTNLIFVVKPYYSVADSSIKVSDDEIKDKYKSLKEQYKQDTKREKKFVSFNKQPRQEDYIQVSEWINKLKPEFESETDVTSIVNANSDIVYKGLSLSEKDIAADLRGFAFSGTKGQIYGPILSEGSYKMARIIQNGISSPDSVKLRHIVILENSSERTAALADSVVGALKGGADFAALALKYSQVKGTATRGGEIGWVREKDLSVEMAQSAFSAPINQVFTIKESGAIQIMQVIEKTANVKKVKLAVIQREVTASSRTQSNIYNKAKQFAAKNKNLETFEAAAKKEGYVIRPYSNIGENQSRLEGIKNSRQIIRWAYQSSKGDISDVFECDNQFIVAALSTINEKGYRPFEDVKDEIKSKVIIEKKADLIANEITSKNASSLQTLAQQLNLPIDTLMQVNFAVNRVGNIGFEPAIIGTAPLAKENVLSKPTKGKLGVFVYSVFSKNETTEKFNVDIEKSTIGMQYSYRIPSIAIQMLKEKADIVDKRSNIF